MIASSAFVFVQRKFEFAWVCLLTRAVSKCFQFNHDRCTPPVKGSVTVSPNRVAKSSKNSTWILSTMWGQRAYLIRYIIFLGWFLAYLMVVPKAFFPSFVFLLFPEVFLAFKHCAVESHFGTCNSFQALVMCRSWHGFSKTWSTNQRLFNWGSTVLAALGWASFLNKSSSIRGWHSSACSTYGGPSTSFFDFDSPRTF